MLDESPGPPRKSNERRFLTTWKVLTILVVLFVIGAIAFLQMTYLMLGWWMDVTFENSSGEAIRITPIGIIEGNREIGPILSVKRSFIFAPVQNTKFALDADENFTMTYDWDDQNLQFVIVEFPDNDTRILKIDAESWEERSYRSCCYFADEETYSIPPKSELPECPEVLKATIHGRRVEVTDDLVDILMSI